jgi:hypothetical protein
LGFSRRALASALGCSEGVIRRYLKLASLPAPSRAALAGGASAKHVLMLKRQSLALPELDSDQQQRIAEERIIHRCLEEVRPWLHRYLPWAGYREQFLDEADRRLWRLGRSVNGEQIHPASPRFATRRYRPRRRPPSYGPELIEYLLEWSVRWAMQVLASRTLRGRLSRLSASPCCFATLKSLARKQTLRAQAVLAGEEIMVCLRSSNGRSALPSRGCALLAAPPSQC